MQKFSKIVKSMEEKKNRRLKMKMKKQMKQSCQTLKMKQSCQTLKMKQSC